MKLPPAPEFFPYGIYTVPEISTVGMSEQEFLEIAMSHQITPYVHDPKKTRPGKAVPDIDRWSREGAMTRVDAEEVMARWRARKSARQSGS